jgi:hypothetical protein
MNSPRAAARGWLVAFQRAEARHANNFQLIATLDAERPRH